MKCRGNQPTMRALIRTLSFSVATALKFLIRSLRQRQRMTMRQSPLSDKARCAFSLLGIGKSVVVDLPRGIKDVLVADPKIANAVVRSPQRAYIIGAAVGQTNVVFFDAADQQIAAYDIAVKRDLNGVRAALRQMLPNSGVPGGRRRRRRHADRLGIQSDRGAAGGRRRRTVGRRRRQGRQLHRGSQPRSGDAEGCGRGSAAGHCQATGRRSQRQHEFRHRGGEFQQHQPVHRKQWAARPQQRLDCRGNRERPALGNRNHARDGECRRRCEHWRSPI